MNNYRNGIKLFGEKKMHDIRKEYIVDETGNPTKVILSLADFRLIEEMLGLDLDEEALADLKQARQDRQNGQLDAFITLDAIE
jgi:PHD/YefM family antitoxin component YafN of YafNO toxin-antitoxin module